MASAPASLIRFLLRSMWVILSLILSSSESTSLRGQTCRFPENEFAPLCKDPHLDLGILDASTLKINLPLGSVGLQIFYNCLAIRKLSRFG